LRSGRCEEHRPGPKLPDLMIWQRARGVVSWEVEAGSRLHGGLVVEHVQLDDDVQAVAGRHCTSGFRQS
jgi:hypothetical protein